MNVQRGSQNAWLSAFQPQAAGVLCVCAALLCGLAGCGDGKTSGELEAIWGSRGISDGRFQKPRAMAIDKDDNLYIVDMTARIQVFNSEGKFLRSWSTPDHTNGRPTGLTVDDEGQVLVADTHYYQVLVYTKEGEFLKTLGNGKGHQPGEFGLVTDAVRDSKGNYYVGEYGEFDRIQKFTPDGTFVKQWGGHGTLPGEFVRPQNLIIDEEDRIWVADACNHRIQVFDTDGKLLFYWGKQGRAPGELSYPYDLDFDADGNLYIVEFGNNRVQKFTRSGESLGCWGRAGRGSGELFNPWALVRDSQGKLHVLDSNNHRVQRITM